MAGRFQPHSTTHAHKAHTPHTRQRIIMAASSMRLTLLGASSSSSRSSTRAASAGGGGRKATSMSPRKLLTTNRTMALPKAPPLRRDARQRRVPRDVSASAAAGDCATADERERGVVVGGDDVAADVDVDMISDVDVDVDVTSSPPSASNTRRAFLATASLAITQPLLTSPNTATSWRGSAALAMVGAACPYVVYHNQSSDTRK